jgi:hypothetical protein
MVRPAYSDIVRTNHPRPESPSGASGAARLVPLVGFSIGCAAASSGVELPLQLFGLRPWHILMGVALTLAVLAEPPGSLRKLRVTSLDGLFLLFIFACGFSEILNATDLHHGIDVATVISPAYYLLGYVAARVSVSSIETLRTFLIAVSLPSIAAAAICVGQFYSASFAKLTLAIAPAPGVDARIQDDRYIRATGLVGHWTGVGFYFCVALACACVVLLMRASDGHNQTTTALPWIIGASTLVGCLTTLTFSVLATALIIVGVTWRRLGLDIVGFIAGAAVALGFYFAFGGLLEERFSQQQLRSEATLPSWVPNTLAYRWQIWTEETLPAIGQRPWLGWGTNVYGSDSQRRIRPTGLVWGSAESQWFATAMTFGAAATIVLAGTIVYTLRQISRYTRSGSGAVYLTPVSALLLCTLVASLTVPAFTNRGMPAILWPVIGAIMAAMAATSWNGSVASRQAQAVDSIPPQARDIKRKGES